jgi:hypothetical protein
LYPSPDVIRVISSRKMRQTGYVESMREMQIQLQSRILKGRGWLKDLGIDKRLILNCLFKELGCKDLDWINLDQDKA